MAKPVAKPVDKPVTDTPFKYQIAEYWGGDWKGLIFGNMMEEFLDNIYAKHVHSPRLSPGEYYFLKDAYGYDMVNPLQEEYEDIFTRDFIREIRDTFKNKNVELMIEKLRKDRPEGWRTEMLKLRANLYVIPASEMTPEVKKQHNDMNKKICSRLEEMFKSRGLLKAFRDELKIEEFQWLTKFNKSLEGTPIMALTYPRDAADKEIELGASFSGEVISTGYIPFTCKKAKNLKEEVHAWKKILKSKNLDLNTKIQQELANENNFLKCLNLDSH